LCNILIIPRDREPKEALFQRTKRAQKSEIPQVKVQTPKAPCLNLTPGGVAILIYGKPNKRLKRYHRHDESVGSFLFAQQQHMAKVPQVFGCATKVLRTQTLGYHCLTTMVMVYCFI